VVRNGLGKLLLREAVPHDPTFQPTNSPFSQSIQEARVRIGPVSRHEVDDRLCRETWNSGAADGEITVHLVPRGGAFRRCTIRPRRAPRISWAPPTPESAATTTASARPSAGPAAAMSNPWSALVITMMPATTAVAPITPRSTRSTGLSERSAFALTR